MKYLVMHIKDDRVIRLLPEKYWNVITSTDLSFDIPPQKKLIAVVIPVFGEELFIKETLRNLASTFSNSDDFFLMFCIVFRKAGDNDKTPEILYDSKKELDLNIVLIDESTFPDPPCIGHARAIGFASSLYISQNNGIVPEEVLLISSDADLVSADEKYLDQIASCFSNSKTSVVSCSNSFLPEVLKNNKELFILKSIEDSFFSSQFKRIGALNGRCYGIRGSAYVKTGGVDYSAQFDDIAFGVSVSKIIPFDEFEWVDMSVYTSERRLVKALGKESLMSLYSERIPLGNESIGVTRINDVSESFIRQHINEGLNTFLFYYSKRYPFSNKSNENMNFSHIKNSLSEFLDSLNRKIQEHLEIVIDDYDQFTSQYIKYSSGDHTGEWWKNTYVFKLIYK